MENKNNRRGRKPVAEADRQRIIAALEKNPNAARVAKEVGNVSRMTVWKIAKQAGVTIWNIAKQEGIALRGAHPRAKGNLHNCKS